MVVRPAGKPEGLRGVSSKTESLLVTTLLASTLESRERKRLPEVAYQTFTNYGTSFLLKQQQRTKLCPLLFYRSSVVVKLARSSRSSRSSTSSSRHEKLTLDCDSLLKRFLLCLPLYREFESNFWHWVIPTNTSAFQFIFSVFLSDDRERNDSFHACFFLVPSSE